MKRVLKQITLRTLSLIAAGIAIAFFAALALSQVPASFLRSGLIFGNSSAQSVSGLLLSGSSDPGIPAIGVVQAAATFSSTSLNVTAGHRLVVFLTSDGPGTTLGPAQDSQANSYTLIASYLNTAIPSTIIKVYLATAGATASDTFSTASGGGLGDFALAVDEISGDNGTVDVLTYATSAGGPPAVTTTLPYDLVLGIAGTYNDKVLGATAPTVLDAQVTHIHIWHLLTSTPGSYQPAITGALDNYTANGTIALEAAPVSSPGNTGDWYLNLTTGVLWGPKAGGLWIQSGWKLTAQ